MTDDTKSLAIAISNGKPFPFCLPHGIFGGLFRGSFLFFAKLGLSCCVGCRITIGGYRSECRKANTSNRFLRLGTKVLDASDEALQGTGHRQTFLAPFLGCLAYGFECGLLNRQDLLTVSQFGSDKAMRLCKCRRRLGCATHHANMLQHLRATGSKAINQTVKRFFDIRSSDVRIMFRRRSNQAILLICECKFFCESAILRRDEIDICNLSPRGLTHLID